MQHRLDLLEKIFVLCGLLLLLAFLVIIMYLNKER